MVKVLDFKRDPLKKMFKDSIQQTQYAQQCLQDSDLLQKVFTVAIDGGYIPEDMISALKAQSQDIDSPEKRQAFYDSIVSAI